VAMEVVELVWMSSTTLVELEPFKLTEEGVTEQIASGGVPEQAKETVPLKPLTDATCAANDPVSPVVIVAELLALPLVIEKSDPLPVKLTVCGLPFASSAIRSEAFLFPAPVGAKVTEIVQVADALNVV
jgi:hypothetical protein